MASTPDPAAEPDSDSIQPLRAIWLSAPQEPPPGPDDTTKPDDRTDGSRPIPERRG